MRGGSGFRATKIRNTGVYGARRVIRGRKHIISAEGRKLRKFDGNKAWGFIEAGLRI